MADLILLAVLAVIIGAAARYLYKAKKRPGHCGGCSSCENGQSCSSCSGCGKNG